MMGRMLNPGTPSNQNRIPMSGKERGIRQLTYDARQ